MRAIATASGGVVFVPDLIEGNAKNATSTKPVSYKDLAATKVSGELKVGLVNHHPAAKVA